MEWDGIWVLPLTKLVKNCKWTFQEGEDGADCDLAEWPAERFCHLTCQRERLCQMQ